MYMSKERSHLIDLVESAEVTYVSRLNPNKYLDRESAITSQFLKPA